MTLDAILKNKGPIRTIGVLGMGYVGIPAAALFADVPQYEQVYGFQRDSPSSGYKIAIRNLIFQIPLAIIKIEQAPAGSFRPPDYIIPLI